MVLGIGGFRLETDDWNGKNLTYVKTQIIIMAFIVIKFRPSKSGIGFSSTLVLSKLSCFSLKR